MLLMGLGVASAQERQRATPLPITEGSSREARLLLRDLYVRKERTTDRVAIGQQLITWEYGPKSDPNAWYGDWLQLEQARLPLPEVMAGELSDLMRYDDFYPNQDALRELLAHGKRGRIVTLVWHPSNPVPGGAFGTPVSTDALRAMVDRNTEIGRRWQIQLDRAASVLAKFQAQKVAVLFRPLHEQNGDFFWWGHNSATGTDLTKRTKAWRAMWQDLVTQLTQVKKLKNLVFVFGTNQVNYNEVAPPLTYYPGDDWCDVVSIDIYDDELDMAGSERGLQYYKQLVRTGKPFGISEFGQSFDSAGGPNAARWDARTLATRIRDSYPATVFAVAWYTSPGQTFALPDVRAAKQLFADPLIDTQ